MPLIAPTVSTVSVTSIVQIEAGVEFPRMKIGERADHVGVRPADRPGRRGHREQAGNDRRAEARDLADAAAGLQRGGAVVVMLVSCGPSPKMLNPVLSTKVMAPAAGAVSRCTFSVAKLTRPTVFPLPSVIACPASFNVSTVRLAAMTLDPDAWVIAPRTDWRPTPCRRRPRARRRPRLRSDGQRVEVMADPGRSTMRCRRRSASSA